MSRTADLGNCTVKIALGIDFSAIGRETVEEENVIYESATCLEGFKNEPAMTFAAPTLGYCVQFHPDLAHVCTQFHSDLIHRGSDPGKKSHRHYELTFAELQAHSLSFVRGGQAPSLRDVSSQGCPGDSPAQC